MHARSDLIGCLENTLFLDFQESDVIGCLEKKKKKKKRGQRLS